MRVRQIVDLSVPVGPGTVVYPGDPSPEFEVAATVPSAFNPRQWSRPAAMLTGYSRQSRYRKLLVAPTNLRTAITQLI